RVLLRRGRRHRRDPPVSRLQRPHGHYPGATRPNFLDPRMASTILSDPSSAARAGFVPHDKHRERLRRRSVAEILTRAAYPAPFRYSPAALCVRARASPCLSARPPLLPCLSPVVERNCCPSAQMLRVSRLRSGSAPYISNTQR